MRSLSISLTFVLLTLAFAGLTKLSAQDSAEQVQTPEALQRRIQRLAPDLIAATVAVLPGGGSGSGVIISPEGLVLTAAHVTDEPGKEIRVLLADGRSLPARSLGVDSTTDAGMVQIDAPGPFPWRPAIEEANYKVGDLVLATGHPGGPVEGRQPPLRIGRIRSAGDGGGFTEPLTTTATVISGDSGGPLWNLDGEVIGIHSNIAMSYSTNNHVTLTAFRERWDELLEGANIGQVDEEEQDETTDPNEVFDQPYAGLRRKYLKALEANREDPEAAKLLARPALLSPHRMQALVDRWDPPEEQGDVRPWFGIVPDLTQPGGIANVVAGSPAERAGLRAGDQVLELDGAPVAHSGSLAVALSNREDEGLAVFGLSDREVQVSPEMRPARPHFPSPISGMIPMQVVGEGGPAAEPEVLLGKELLGRAKSLGQQSQGSFLEISRGTQVVGLVTVVSANGELLAKASLVEEPTAKDTQDGSSRALTTDLGPVEVLAVDEERDLALLRLKDRAPSGTLRPVVWQSREPRVGSLMFSPTPKYVLTGAVTQSARPTPKKGHERDNSGGQPPVWMGVVFEQGSLEPVIARIESPSPADRAGLLEGDRIVSIDRRDTETVQDVAARLRDRQSGEKIRLVVGRGNDEIKVDLILDPAPVGSSGYSRRAAMRDDSLRSLSARGGELSDRAFGFPRCLYHDQIIRPTQCGGPILDLDGRAVGINIARVFRHRTLALPAAEVEKALAQLRFKAGTETDQAK